MEATVHKQDKIKSKLLVWCITFKEQIPQILEAFPGSKQIGEYMTLIGKFKDMKEFINILKVACKNSPIAKRLSVDGCFRTLPVMEVKNGRSNNQAGRQRT